MSTLLDLTVDIQNKKLYVNNAAATVVAALAFTRQDYVQLRIQPVKRNLVGGLRNQIEIVDVTPLTLQVAAGPWADPYAQQLTWTKDETNNWFTASLNFNTTELETAFTADPDYLDTNIQFRFIEDGQPVSVIVPCRILNSIIQTGSPAPEEIDPPSALVANLALILTDSDDIDVQQSGNTFLFVLKDAGRPTHWTAASQVAMLALAARKGDSCERTDTGRCWLLTTSDPTQLANWYEVPAGFEWQGTWSSGTTYAVNHAVGKNGSSYVSLQSANTNHDPADPANIGVWWDVFAQGSTIQLATASELPSQITEQASSNQGTGPKAARSDHVHKAVVATQLAAGLHSATDKKRFDRTLGPYAGGFDAAPTAVLVDGDVILVAGPFTKYGNLAAPGIAMLDKHGFPVPTFDPGTGFAAAGKISHIRKASDGDYVMCDNAKTSYRGATATWLHKIDATGTPDPAFTSPSTMAVTGSDEITGMEVSTGKIWCATWRSVRVMDLTGTTTATATATNDNCHWLARKPGTDLVMLATKSDTAFNGYAVPGAMRLLADDLTRNGDWVTGAGNGGDTGIHMALWAPSAEFILASNGGNAGIGTYAWNGGAANKHKGIYKIAASGAEDANWTSTIVMADGTNKPFVLGVDSQNRVYLTGNIATIDGTAVTANRLYRLTENGAFDREFAGFDGTVNIASVVDDEHILVLGAFTHYGDAEVGYAVMLDSDGNMIPSLSQDATDHQTITVAAAGTSRIHPKHQGVLSLLVDVNDTYDRVLFTHTFKLPEFGATEGDRVRAVFDLPASTDPTLTVLADDGSTVLSFTSLSFASILEVDFVFKSGAWVAEVPRWTNAAGAPAQNAYVLGTTTYGASVGVDLDGPAYQQITATGALELSTLSGSRAGSGEAKSVTLFITASGGDRTITFAAGIKGIGDTLPSGKTAAVCLVSRGANETDTVAAYAQLD